jgi:hypothetical protein
MTVKKKKKMIGGKVVLEKYGPQHFVMLAKKRAEMQRKAMELWKKTQKKKLQKKTGKH